MGMITVVMVDQDENYLAPLELKFLDEYPDTVDIRMISDIQYLHEYFSSPHEIDILIIQEELYTAEIEKHNIKNVFLLCEELVCESTSNFNVNIIYKYTSVREIFTIIKNNLQELGDKTSEGCKLITIYSPVGGSGKTTIALGITAALAQMNKKVLYIDTSTIQSFDIFFENSQWMPKDFSRFIMARDESVLTKLNMFCGNNGFDYFLPMQQSISSQRITVKDYIGLIDVLKRESDYNYIIVDTSSDFTVDKSQLMGISNFVLTVLEQDKVSSIKLERLLNNIDASDRNKFLFVCNRYEKEIANYLPNILAGKITNMQYITRKEKEEIQAISKLEKNKEFMQLLYCFI